MYKLKCADAPIRFEASGASSVLVRVTKDALGRANLLMSNPSCREVPNRLGGSLALPGSLVLPLNPQLQDSPYAGSDAKGA